MIKTLVVCSLGLLAWCGSMPVEASSALYHGTDLDLLSPVPDSTGTNGFGYSVAVRKGVALVGAHRESGTGQAHLYDSYTGNLLKTLLPPVVEDQYNSNFGRHVALDESYALVSSLRGTHVYDLENYELLHVLPASPNNLPGSQGIDIDNGRAIVVDRGRGSFVYDLTSGEQLAYMAGNSNSVAISDNHVAIAYRHTDIVAVGDWTQEKELFRVLPENLPEVSSFGKSLGIENGYLVVGGNSTSNHVGSAYVFNSSNGEFLHELNGATQVFGTDIAIEGNTVVISAHNQRLSLVWEGESRESSSNNRGAAYAFDLESGEELRRFTTLGPKTGGWAHYGFSLDYDGHQIIAGNLGWPSKAYLTTFEVPEPSTILIGIAGIMPLACRRREKLF